MLFVFLTGWAGFCVFFGVYGIIVILVAFLDSKFRTMIQDELTEAIIGAAFRVHKVLGAGFLEKVYENALCVELARVGIQHQQQYPVQVWYEGIVVGDFFADLFVEGKVIIELKAVENLHPAHETQLVNYLKATETDIGLLINFGTSVEVKRKFRTYQKGV